VGKVFWKRKMSEEDQEALRNATPQNGCALRAPGLMAPSEVAAM